MQVKLILKVHRGSTEELFPVSVSFLENKRLFLLIGEENMKCIQATYVNDILTSKYSFFSSTKQPKEEKITV